MPLIISILFVIGHHEHIFLIEINDIDAMVLQENHVFSPFSLESKFIYQMR